MANEVIIIEAREIVRDSAILTSEQTYTDVRVDRAIQLALGRAARISKADYDFTDVALAGASRTDAFTEIVGWASQQWLAGWITDIPVIKINYDSLTRFYYDGTVVQGKPEHIAWPKDDEAHLYPTPDVAYTLKVKYWKPLIDWIPGDPAADDTKLNVPGEWVREALWWGASAALVHADPDELMQTTSWNRFERLLMENRGSDTAGDLVSFKNRV